MSRYFCKASLQKKKKKKKNTTNPATTKTYTRKKNRGNFSARTKGRRKKEFNFGEDASGPKKVQVPVLSLLVRKKRKEKKTPMVIGDLGAARLIHQ